MSKKKTTEVVSKNNNLLAGMCCPKCKCLGPFIIQASCVAEVWDEGVEETTDFEWEDEDGCWCKACGHEGIVHGFREDKQ